MNMVSCLWWGSRQRDPHRLYIDFDKHQPVSVSFSSQKPSETPQLTTAVKSRSRPRLNALAFCLQSVVRDSLKVTDCKHRNAKLQLPVSPVSFHLARGKKGPIVEREIAEVEAEPSGSSASLLTGAAATFSAHAAALVLTYCLTDGWHMVACVTAPIVSVACWDCVAVTELWWALRAVKPRCPTSGCHGRRLLAALLRSCLRPPRFPPSPARAVSRRVVPVAKWKSHGSISVN